MNAPFLQIGKVDIHLRPLQCDASELERLRGYLSEDEANRGSRLVDPVKKKQFHLSRGFVREILAGYLGSEPAALRFSYGPHGKPFLDPEIHGASIWFNLSHSGDLALLAVSGEGEVGIDLEVVAPDLSFPAMATRYFSLREQEELFSLPREHQVSAFYRCWTRKEAYIKAIGSGFSKPSNQFEVSLLRGMEPVILEDRTDPREPQRWKLTDLSVPQGYIAALALRRPR